MLNIENKAQFAKFVSDAIEKVAIAVENERNARRWVNAITKAAEQIEEHSEFMTWQDDHLLIWSTSNEIYTANDACQCKAYAEGEPCWHRAAARLVRLYTEAQAASKAAPPVSLNAAPYIKPASGKRPERCGSIRF